MKITTKNLYSSGYTTSSVSTYVDNSMENRLCEGELESVRGRCNKVSHSFGTLIEILADKGILDVNDVIKIAGKYETEVNFEK